jgi:arginase family enzyme
MARTMSVAKDLPALAGGTQPGRFDDRVPEVVVVLSGDLATTQAHSQAHRVFPVAVVPFDALLHGHATGESSRGRREDHHEPVTQVLHLGATDLGNGLAQDREVPTADLVSSIG